MNPDEQAKQQIPTPPTPVAPHNPYGFILETPHKKKRGIFKPNNNSTASRILFVVGGLFLLVIAASVLSSVLSKGSKDSVQTLTKLAAQQQEIIRIADLGIKGSIDPSLAAYAQTTKSTVQSHQTKVTGVLLRNKIKVTPLMLNAQKNTRIDTALVTASTANRFDTVYKDTLTAILTTYAADLKIDYNSTSTKSNKEIFGTAYNNTALLLK